MPDKPKSLPPPPDQTGFMAKLLALAEHLGISPQPIAQSRITRTPIYQGVNLPGAAGGYYPTTSTIGIKPDRLGDMDASVIPHESAHAIFDKGNLAPLASQLVGKVPYSASQEVTESPELYPSPGDTTMANEGLGYSIGKTWGTPYVEHVASKLKDPILAQQLLRLHRNALAARNPLAEQ